ncbi:uncharacterized protein LOC109849960 isoform X2 [Asparagus officinalis]|uniref:uncharacterized protein LOC109849960 isoform X2 n=1 Tax=Asparagus officinalis TaxID=4686 RepID=UPI00098E2E3A|nr:uncharacterized protein LOC109849960 isoform X2 [Asparagus officinalis]
MMMVDLSSRALWTAVLILLSSGISCDSWCPTPNRDSTSAKFQQKATKFWEFEQTSKRWVEISYPFDLMSCVDGNCTKVGSIEKTEEKQSRAKITKEDGLELVLPLRKRLSLTRMSESSLWVTGQSGSIYERFWNGVEWVIAPHELPTSAGQAISVFIINQTILSLSEAGMLYQLELNENSQPIWTEFTLLSDPKIHTAGTEQKSTMRIKSGLVSNDGERLYLSTTNGSLLEISEIQPLRLYYHGRPPGGDVVAIADSGSIRPGVVFTVSTLGDLYEFDRKSKPAWKKHIWSEKTTKEILLAPLTGCRINGISGTHSHSLFLLTKDGFLVERRLHKRKWKWRVHGAPEGYYFSAITSAQQNDINERMLSLFLTTTGGSVYEYQLPKNSGVKHGDEIEGLWLNHNHPKQAKIARGIHGVQIQTGRFIFPLDDGRLGELHLTGIGGENIGPTLQISNRRKTSNKYEWSILDAPETEGWNAEYCTEENGPSNCIAGTKNSGVTFEYLYTENVWLWLRHEQSTAIKGALGSYNGSLFLVDTHGSLLLRERSGNELLWINCTAMKNGRHVESGPPWDVIPGTVRRVTSEDALYFVNKKGRLIQFTVALRKFKWKDCRSPPNIKIAYIVDQEVFRLNIIFIVGRNGHLYQYNSITDLWHEHYQSPYLVLSRSPGTAMRPSPLSLTGSLFMISENGGLVEYNWNSLVGWEWVEHGTPYRDVILVGAPGPSFDGTQLFVVGSDGCVYRRHLDQITWKWTSHGYPYTQNGALEAPRRSSENQKCGADDENVAKFEEDQHYTDSIKGSCNEKVAPTRPIPFSEGSVIFELQDGRLAELQKGSGDAEWEWVRIIGTPTSLCLTAYWTAVAS